jgi:hypothetical protein
VRGEHHRHSGAPRNEQRQSSENKNADNRPPFAIELAGIIHIASGVISIDIGFQPALDSAIHLWQRQGFVNEKSILTEKMIDRQSDSFISRISTGYLSQWTKTPHFGQ